MFTETFMFIVFAIVIVAMLFLDLGFFNKKTHKVTNKEAVTWSLIWIGISLLFGGFIYVTLGGIKASEFLTAYIVEKSLSVDNLFVFILIFNYFKVEGSHQHKVLFYGILGAIVLRAIFIFAGLGIINATYLPAFNLFGHSITPNPVLLFFGGFLVYAGIKTLLSNEDEEDDDYSKTKGYKWGKGLIQTFFKHPVSESYDGSNFFTIKNGVKMITPLLIVVGVIEVSDLLFAVDSIPAIFTISKDPFILYTSNIFAILGLRTLYFLLSNMIDMFHYLKYGVSIVLTFIGIKMLIVDFVHISSPLSLAIVGGVLVFSIILSLLIPVKEEVTVE